MSRLSSRLLLATKDIYGIHVGVDNGRTNTVELVTPLLVRGTSVPGLCDHGAGRDGRGGEGGEGGGGVAPSFGRSWPSQDVVTRFGFV